MTATSNNGPATAFTPSNAQELKWLGHMADDGAATFGPDPMASLTATADTLVLAGSRGTFRVPRTAVVKVGRGGMYPWFFSGVRIHHNLASYPRDLQFKPMDAKLRDILSQLGRLGYPAR